MKKIVVGILALLMALSACTAGGTQVEEVATPTETALQPAPTETDEPTAEPTATDIPTETPEPTETPTAVPTATKAPPTATVQAVATPTKELSQSEGEIPETVEMPEGAVIVFTKMGGFAGLQDTWVFYANGRTTLNGVDQAQLSPEHISDVVNQLEALGFFEISYFTKPGTICCDFFEYTITAEKGEMKNFAGYSDGDENAPANLREAGTLILMELVQEAQQR